MLVPDLHLLALVAGLATAAATLLIHQLADRFTPVEAMVIRQEMKIVLTSRFAQVVEACTSSLRAHHPECQSSTVISVRVLKEQHG